LGQGRACRCVWFHRSAGTCRGASQQPCEEEEEEEEEEEKLKE